MNPKTLLSNLFKLKYFLILFVFFFLIFFGKKTFALTVPAPSLSTPSATAITTTSVTLNGTVAGNSAGSVGFNYGISTSYGTTVTATTPLGGIGYFSYNVTGLTCGTLYYYREFGTNSGGTTYATGSFTTSACPTAPTVTTSPALYISTSTAQLNGIVSSPGVGTTVISHGYLFGTTTTYGTTYALTSYSASLSFPHSSGGYSGSTGWLTCGTTYHYEYYATSDNGLTGYGGDASFTTGSCSLPTVSTLSATSIATSSAVLNGSITSTGGTNALSYSFNYGLTTSYGTTTTTTGSFGVGSYSKTVTGLLCNTTYHFNFYATNSVGTNSPAASDFSFTTNTCQVPTVSTATSTSVATSSATLNGIILNNNAATSTTRGFNYGLSTSYGITTSTTGSFATGTFSQTITGLNCGTPYHYNAFAINSYGWNNPAADSSFVTGNDPLTCPYYWSSVVTSSNGSHIVGDIHGGYGGGVYSSTNYGVSWTRKIPGYADTSVGSSSFQAVTASSDGTKVTAAVAGGYIYNSSDSGITWATSSAPAANWNVLADSSDGTKVFAGIFSASNYLYTSSDSGSTWTAQTGTGSHNWLAIASNASGTKLIAATESGLMVSTNSGVSFTVSTPSGSHSWTGVASSADGVTLYASDGYPGYVWKSTNSGSTWTQLTSSGSHYWQAITSSSDGTKVFVADHGASGAGGYIYMSLDGGTTWSQRTSLGFRNWSSIDSSSSSTQVVAVGSPDILVIFNPISSIVTTLTPTSIGTSTATLNGYIVNTGAANATSTGFNYGLDTSYGTTTSTAGSFATGTFSQTITGLNCGTTYHYNAFAQNLYGYNSPNASDTSFTTIDGSIVGGVGDTSACKHNWTGITSSSDGSNLAAINSPTTSFPGDGYIYTSSDSGQTWTKQTGLGPHYWIGITSSASGQYLAAIDGHASLPYVAGYVYTSSDYGVTWVQRTGSGPNYFGAITSSPDGSHLLLSGNSYLYISSDYGASWSINYSVYQPVAGAIFGDGIYAVDGSGSHSIYLSADNGSTWYGIGPVSGYHSFKMSSDESKIVAAGGYSLYYSSDGTTFNVISPFPSGVYGWLGEITPDGTKIIAHKAGYTYLYVSSDGGVTWSSIDDVQTKSGLISANTYVAPSNGSSTAVAVAGDMIYIENTPAVTTIDATSVGTSTVVMNGTITDTGGSTSTTVGFNYGPSNAYGTTSVMTGSYGIGDFSQTLTGFQCDSIYYYNAYAINGFGIDNPAASTTHFLTNGNTTDCNHNWGSVVSSGDGQKLFATFPYTSLTMYIAGYGYVYGSTDSGYNWTRKTPDYDSHTLGQITSSLDGSHLAVLDNFRYGAIMDDRVLTSSDGGNTWATNNVLPHVSGLGHTHSWYSISSSSDGSQILIIGSDYYSGVYHGMSYSSSDGGTTWVAQTLPGTCNSSTCALRSVTMSGDGTKAIIRNSTNSHIFTGIYSGGVWAWTDRTPPFTEYWTGGYGGYGVLDISYSSDGSRVAALGNVSGSGTYIFTSTDNGTTWATSSASQTWQSVSLSGDGNRMAAVNSTTGYINIGDYIAGAWVWTPLTAFGSRTWDTVHISSNKSKLIAAKSNDQVYTLDLPALNLSINSIPANGTTTIVSLPSVGGDLSIGWTTQNLSSTSVCVASGDWSGNKSSSGGSDTITVPANTTTSTITKTYTLGGCVSASGVPVATTTATVSVAPTTGNYVSLLVNGQTTASTSRLNIISGDPVTLSWTVQNVVGNSCYGTSSGSFTGWNSTLKSPTSTVDSSSMAFSEVVGTDNSITTPRTYTISCTNTSTTGGGTSSSTAYIGIDTSPIVHLYANGIQGTSVVPTINLPSASTSVTLLWTTANVTSCSAGDSWSGSKSATSGSSQTVTVPANLTPATTTYAYTMTCLNSLGQATSPTSVTVQRSPTTTPNVFLYANSTLATSTDSSATPTALIAQSGGSLHLSWISNVSSCTATGGTTGDGWSGSKATSGDFYTTLSSNTTTSILTKTYSIHCSGAATTTAYVDIVATSTSFLLMSVNGQQTSTSSHLAVSSGSSPSISWNIQNVQGSSCIGTSSGSYTGWASTTKLPLATVGASSTMFSENVSIPSSTSTSSRTYTMNCTPISGGNITDTVYLDVIGTYDILTNCSGLGCGISASSTSNGIIRLPWLEI